MAIVDVAGNVSPPVKIMEGYFDRDTLVASGDGTGRIAYSVIDRAPGSPGLKVYIAAPTVPRNGGLTIRPTGAAVELEWEPNGIFPAAPGIVETSQDLIHWVPLGTPLGAPLGTPPYHSTFSPLRHTLTFPGISGETSRFFRLRPVLLPPP